MRGCDAQAMSSSLDATRLDRPGSCAVNIEDGSVSSPTAPSVPVQQYIASLRVLQNSMKFISCTVADTSCRLSLTTLVAWQYTRNCHYADVLELLVFQCTGDYCCVFTNFLIYIFLYCLGSVGAPVQRELKQSLLFDEYQGLYLFNVLYIRGLFIVDRLFHWPCLQLEILWSFFTGLKDAVLIIILKNQCFRR